MARAETYKINNGKMPSGKAHSGKTRSGKARNGLHETTKSRILEAALQRFSHYGYGKTTVGEIAADCKMSPGNLYRYFENKLAIAHNLVRDGDELKNQQLKKIIKRAGDCAEEQLRACLFGNLSLTFSSLKSHPNFIEIGRKVHKEDIGLRRDEVRQFDDILKQIIQKGKDEGVFKVNCVLSAAHIIQCATCRFNYPQAIAPEGKFSQLKKELEAVYHMILTALQTGIDYQIPKGSHYVGPDVAPESLSESIVFSHDESPEVEAPKKMAFF